MKQFDEWNDVKKNIHAKKQLALFKERDIFWANIGENVGYEQCGKGDDFTRPVLVLKKFTNTIFFGIPLSTQLKKGNFFFEFEFIVGEKSTALLVQAKMFDVKRLDRKIGTMQKGDFEQLKNQMRNLLALCSSPSEIQRAKPESNCKRNYTP